MPPARTTSLSGPATGPTVGPTSLGVSLAVHGVAVASIVFAFYAPRTPTEPEDGSRQVVAAQIEVTDRSILEDPIQETLAAIDVPVDVIEPIPLDDISDLFDEPLPDPFADAVIEYHAAPQIAAPDLDPERLLEDPQLRKEAPAEPASLEAITPAEPEPEPAVTDAAPEAEAPDPGAIVAPSPIASECPPPAYPRLAERRGWTGTVVLLIDVAADGTVSDVRIESSSGHDILDEAAVAAVRTWRYRPGTLGGEAAGLVVRKPIRFDR